MTVSPGFSTPRLQLIPLSAGDAVFIYNLVNTPGWLRFIGDRNVQSPEDGLLYIQKILNNPDVAYWVVRRNNDETPIGVITRIQRDYLEHPDIGFAFLPEASGQGFAYEAAAVVLPYLSQQAPHILATTIPENARSIRLLEKLGLRYDKAIAVHGEQLLVYTTKP